MTRKKDTALAQPVAPDKWERQRQAERITLQDRKTVPHLKIGRASCRERV